jgi:hypothetical protein
MQLPDSSVHFKDFRTIWADMRFQFIFSSAPENINPVDWFNMLVDSAFGAHSSSADSFFRFSSLSAAFSPAAGIALFYLYLFQHFYFTWTTPNVI